MSLHGHHEEELYGLAAEYEDQHDLLEAVRAARAEGYTIMEAYSPLPLEEVAHAIGHKNRIPLIVLAGGAFGALVGYGMQYWMSAVDYPLNVAGKPHDSWAPFIVITFEMTVLCAALAAVLGMLMLNGLPRPHHPIFGMPGFERASRDRFFLMVLARDPRFDRNAVRALLEKTTTRRVAEVPA